MFRTLLTLLLTAPIAFAAPSIAIADGKIVVTGVADSKGLSVVVAEGTEDEMCLSFLGVSFDNPSALDLFMFRRHNQRR